MFRNLRRAAAGSPALAGLVVALPAAAGQLVERDDRGAR